MSAVVCLLAACRWEAVQVFVGWLWVALRSKWWTDEALQKTHRSQTLQCSQCDRWVCVCDHSVSNRLWAIHNHFCFIFRCFSRSDHLALHMKRHTWTQNPKDLPQNPKDLPKLVFLCIRWVSVLQIFHLLAKDIVSAEHW